MAIKPDTNDLYIVTNDGNGGEGSNIFHAKTFAKALALYSHRDLKMSASRPKPRG
jgi:lactonase